MDKKKELEKLQNGMKRILEMQKLYKESNTNLDEVHFSLVEELKKIISETKGNDKKAVMADLSETENRYEKHLKSKDKELARYEKELAGYKKNIADIEKDLK